MRKYLPPTMKQIPVEAKCKFRGEIFDVYQWPQKMFDGTTKTFEMLKRDDTVTTVAVKNDKVVITYQTQPGQDWFYDLPGGRHDNPQEDELMAAQRELKEETGMVFKNWKLVEAKQLFLKIDWIVYTFVAMDFVEEGEQELDAGEKIEVLELTLDELREYAKKPNAKHILPNFLKKVSCLEELRELPALYKY